MLCHLRNYAYRIFVMLVETAHMVATGTPIAETPVTMDVIVATGRPPISTVGETELVMTPDTQTAPAAMLVIVATGRPPTMIVGAPGPVITSPVAV